MTRQRFAVGLIVASSLLAACSEKPDIAAAPADAPAAAVETPVEVAPTIDASARSFETWDPIGAPTVRDSAADAPDGSRSADTLVLKLNEGFGITNQTPVAAGETRSAKLMLWGTEGGVVALQIADWCDGMASEVKTVVVTLTGAPVETEISQTFANPDPCSRFQVISQSNDPIEVNVWNSRFGS